MKRITAILSALFKIIVMRIITFFIPLKENKYFCISMLGKNYGDNIKPLADLINSKENSIIIWAFNDVFFFQVKSEYRKVRMYSWAYYYHIMTAKYILNNQNLYDAPLVKRRNQVFLQTWHGTALKRLGYSYLKDAKFSIRKCFDLYNVFVMNHVNDILLSNSDFMTKVFREAYHYNKQIYEIGTPRNDIFFKDVNYISKMIKGLYHIPITNKIILYAPTFRTNKTFDYYNFDFVKLYELLSRNNNDNYSLLLRLHPNLIDQSTQIDNLYKINTINVTTHPDMQELLCAADILVTDYSSCMFDFMYLKRPIILYVPDKKEYDRGFYLDINDLPFVVINNNEEIEYKIGRMNIEKYNSDVDSFLNKIGSVENGNATVRCYNILKTTAN